MRVFYLIILPKTLIVVVGSPHHFNYIMGIGKPTPTITIAGFEYQMSLASY